jgi:serine/threonine protein kinase/formylglycine-generating enzyme required for sulfatase activity
MSTIEPDATVPRRYTQAGDYDLIRKMGSGGFGVVFEARHRRTGLMYALKRVELSAEDAQRFENEALYPAKIASRSLHVLGVQNFFHDPGEDVFYLVTELVPHGDLRNFLDNNPKPLPLAQALEVAIGIAKGLVAIHAQGIIHRDLKPANVLMDQKDEQWVPKIADFGLARSTNSISIGEFASSGYAAPEQLDLLSDQPLGPESDLFSFGMILYELLTGQKPTAARDIREYGRWIGTRQMPAPPSTVRAELTAWPQLDALLVSLLQFDRTQRANGASDVVKTLTHVLRRVESDASRESDERVTNRGEQQTAKPQQAKPAPASTSTPGKSTTAPAEAVASAWPRRRTLVYMAGIFVVTGMSMTLGVPWVYPPSKFFTMPPVPLPIFGGTPSAPLYAKASWLLLPALFGLAVARAVRLNASGAAIVSVLSAAAYQLAVYVPLLMLNAIGAVLRANLSNVTTPEAGLWLFPVVAGTVGALLVRAALAWWYRPSRRDLIVTAAAGALSGAVFLAATLLEGVGKAIGQSLFFGLFFTIWQVAVGLILVDRILFKTSTTARDWSLKPVLIAVVLASLMGVVGTWARTRPVPIQAGKLEQNPKNQTYYAWIPPGEFQMGCSADDSECGQDEQPPRTVTFTKGFWLGTSEISVKTWKAAPGDRARPLNTDWGKVVHNVWDANPIASVTWTEARDYCSAMDGRLPTEAEWEYAARAGASGARYGRLNEIAHYAENSGTSLTQVSNTELLSDQALEEALSANRNYAASTGNRRSNTWSLGDMLGNVAEWVEDDYADTTYSVVSGPLTDPPAHLTGVARAPKVVRGGSWGSRPREVRASARGKQDPEARSVFVGFRCVWNGPQAQK